MASTEGAAGVAGVAVDAGVGLADADVAAEGLSAPADGAIDPLVQATSVSAAATRAPETREPRALVRVIAEV